MFQSRVTKDVAPFKLLDAATTLDLNLPCVVTACAAATKTDGSPAAQLCLSSFGGRYKKDPHCKENKFLQHSVVDAKAKVLFNEMFASVAFPKERCTAEDLPKDFPDVTKNVWLYGFDVSYRCVQPVFNGFGVQKVLFSGETRIIAMEVRSLLAGLKLLFPQSPEEVGIDELTKTIETLSPADVKALKGHGCTMYSHLHKAKELVFIPVGWIFAESLTTNGILHYGVRKSFFSCTADNIAQYGELVGTHKVGKKNIARMEHVLSAMKAKALDLAA